jgi:hypothetical protein
MKWKLEPEKALKADAPKMGWWRYGQNNSGGVFDKEGGDSTYIRATSASQANDIAENNGIYFDGVDDGVDCPCCGDRWSSAWGNEPDIEDCTVAELAEKLVANGELKWAASWKLGIRIIDSDGSVHWLRADGK